jgi:hypothetical protein
MGSIAINIGSHVCQNGRTAPVAPTGVATEENVRRAVYYGVNTAAVVLVDDGGQDVGEAEAAADPIGWFQTPTVAPLSALLHESSLPRLDSVRLHMEGGDDDEEANDLAPAALVQRRLLRDAYLTLAQQFGPRFQFMEEEA